MPDVVAHRLADRRAWAIDTLRVHVERHGQCAYCSVRDATVTTWPCLPAQVAMVYSGGPRTP